MTHSGLKTKLEYSDYVHIPSDGKRYELLEGDLHVTPRRRVPSISGYPNGFSEGWKPISKPQAEEKYLMRRST